MRSEPSRVSEKLQFLPILAWVSGSVFKKNWPDHGLSEIVTGAPREEAIGPSLVNRQHFSRVVCRCRNGLLPTEH